MAHRRAPPPRRDARARHHERHPHQRFLQGLAVVPEVARRPPQRPLGLAADAVVDGRLRPPVDRQAPVDAAPGRLVAQAARLEVRVLAVVACQHHESVRAGGVGGGADPVVHAGDRPLVGVAAVGPVLEPGRIRARRVRVPQVHEREERPVAGGELRDMGDALLAPGRMHRAPRDVPVLGVREAAEGADRVEQRARRRAPAGVAGPGDLLGGRGHRLRQLCATQPLHAVRARIAAGEDGGDRRRRRRAGRVAGLKAGRARREPAGPRPRPAPAGEHVRAEAVDHDQEQVGHGPRIVVTRLPAVRSWCPAMNISRAA